jgi:hypothetical protein
MSQSRLLLGKLTVPQPVKKLPNFMQPEDSLPHSQQLATSPYTEQIKPVHALWSYFFKEHLILLSLLGLCLASGFFPSNLPIKTYYVSLFVPYVPQAQPILCSLIWSTINTWWRAQTIKLLIMNFFPVLFHILPVHAITRWCIGLCWLGSPVARTLFGM